MTNPLEPLVAETWRDLEIAAGAKGQLAARMLHVPVENVRAILEDRRSLQGEVERLRDDAHSFKNFHRVLCERFDYTHDEKDWRRDQVSLIEWIAKRRAEKAEATRPEAVVVKGLPWAQNGRAEYSMWANVDHIDRCYTIEPNSNVFEVETRVFLSEYGSDSLGLHPTFEAAKAAAQADYERRILSAIELKPVAVAVTEAMRKAAAKEIGLAFQLHDLGRRNADGDFICTADQIDLLERLSNEAARSALEAALQSSVGAAGEPPAQPAGEGEAI
jgi:hypothetical protein